MRKKSKEITKFIKLVSDIFGENTFTITDHWDDFDAIGLEKDKKLIYISTYKLKPNHYFYECEILLDDNDIPYISSGKDDNVNKKTLLEVMSEFFAIKAKL